MSLKWGQKVVRDKWRQRGQMYFNRISCNPSWPYTLSDHLKLLILFASTTFVSEVLGFQRVPHLSYAVLGMESSVLCMLGKYSAN